MDHTVQGEEMGAEGKGALPSGNISQTGEEANDSIPEYLILKDSKAQLKKKISKALPGLRFDTAEMQQFMGPFPMLEVPARQLVADLTSELR